MSRVLAFLYGIVSYAIALGTILYTIGFIMGHFVPKTVDTGAITSHGKAAFIDIILVSLFALQHSVMARESFKAWWLRIIPSAIERSTYVLFSSLALIVLFWQWHPISGVIWIIQDPRLVGVVTILSACGWLLVLASTFSISHFELFGLQQVLCNLVGGKAPAPKFMVPLLYKIVRHPLYLGLLIAFWVTPSMTTGHLLFAVLNTAYIVFGMTLEERDLITIFGDEYRRYKQKVPMLLPLRVLSAGDKVTSRSRQS